MTDHRPGGMPAGGAPVGRLGTFTSALVGSFHPALTACPKQDVFRRARHALTPP